MWKKLYKSIGLLFFFIFSLVIVTKVQAQCTLYDYNGNPSNNPYWYSCNGNNFILNIQSPQNQANYTIDWGDGSALQTGSGLNYPGSVFHNYTAAVDTFIVVFTNTGTGCVVQGVLVMEESTSSSIQIPIGGLTQACAPQTMEFINSSTNTSQTTIFTWDFGDNSGIEVYDYTNQGQTVSHTYQPGTVECETFVTLTSENYCNTVQGGPSAATFNPIRIWDIDDAGIGSSSNLLCYPDTEVILTNSTERNCFFQGNIYQRYEYWNFGDYWGLGYDSIVTWTPWPPTFPHNIAYPGIGTYEVLLLDSNLCGIDAVYTTIEIVGPPTANISTIGDTICAGQSVTFQNNSSNNANAFRWNFGDGSGWINAGQGNVTKIYNTPGTYIVKLVARVNGPSNLCTDTATTQVVVLPGPVALILISDPSACDSLAVTFTDGSSANSISWDWNFGNGNTSNVQNPPSQLYTIESAYFISLIVTSTNGCVNTDTAKVNVYSSPIVNIIPENICQGETSQFIDGSIVSGGDNIVNWNWYFGDGTFSNDQDPEHLYITSGSYTVLLTVSTPNCSADGSIDINVEATPITAFTTSINQGCNPVKVEFTNQTQFAVDYIWNFGDGNISSEFEPEHTYINNSSNDVTFNCMLIGLNAYGCADTAYFPITVHPYTEADFYSNAVPGCAAVPAQFTNLSSGAASFEWNFGDGSPTNYLQNPFHQFLNQTQFIENYEVQLIAISSFGCNDTITDYISAYPIPNFDFTLDSDSGCAPFEVDFPQVTGAIQFNWNFGDFITSTQPSPTHVFNNISLNPQSYEVTLIALSPFGCYDTSKANIVVMPNPIASFQPSITSGCADLDVQFINTSQIADAYNWNYDNGQTSDTAAITHGMQFQNNTLTTQDFNISLTVTTDFGCTDTDQHTIQVYPIPIAAFTSDTVGCSPLGINFSNQSEIANNFYWNFGDGYQAFSSDPIHIFYNLGNSNITYNTEMIAVSVYGCRDTATTNITVFPLPEAIIEIDTTYGCYPLVVSINNNSIDAISYNWNYGDGSTSSTDSLNQEHTYYNITNSLAQYNIILTATSANGCLSSTDMNVLVPPQIIAGFVADTIGCTPLPLNFTNTSIGAISYFWSFGDGEVDYSSTPQHTFTNFGNADSVYTVTLIVESAFGCTDTITQNITVFAAPAASFTISPQSQIFPDATVVIQNSSSSGSVEYSWTFGNGEVVSTFDYNAVDTVTYLNWGEYSITLNVDNGICDATAIENIVIEPPLPIAYFTGENIGCEPLLVQFQNLSQYGVYFTWYFGDGSSSNQQNPEHVYYEPGTYSVVLEVTGPGGDIDIYVKQNAVTVYKRANAIFTVSPESVFVPSETVYFTNLSEYASTFIWDFGDGSTSTEFSPEYNYNNEGWYNVILIANNEFGCPDTLKLDDAVFGKNDRGLEFPNAFTPNTQQSNGGLFSQLDPYANDVFFPLYKGVSEYNLMIFNRWGELLFESTDVKRGWDGYYRGEICKQDVYVWKVKAKFLDDSEIFKAGDVTLLR